MSIELSCTQSAYKKITLKLSNVIESESLLAKISLKGRGNDRIKSGSCDNRKPSSTYPAIRPLGEVGDFVGVDLVVAPLRSFDGHVGPAFLALRVAHTAGLLAVSRRTIATTTSAAAAASTAGGHLVQKLILSLLPLGLLMDLRKKDFNVN